MADRQPLEASVAKQTTVACLQHYPGVVGRSRVTLALASSAFVGCGAFAGPASADPPLTQDEVNFISAVAPQGYSGDVYATVRAGHQVCSLLDQGLSHVAIQRFVVDTFSDRRQIADYYAALFSQYSAYNLCPRHIGEFGQI
jgi:hypothetical protein